MSVAEIQSGGHPEHGRRVRTVLAPYDIIAVSATEVPAILWGQVGADANKKLADGGGEDGHGLRASHCANFAQSGVLDP